MIIDYVGQNMISTSRLYSDKFLLNYILDINERDDNLNLAKISYTHNDADRFIKPRRNYLTFNKNTFARKILKQFVSIWILFES